MEQKKILYIYIYIYIYIDTYRHIIIVIALLCDYDYYIILYYIILYYIILYYIYVAHVHTHARARARAHAFTQYKHNVSFATPAMWQRGARREGERMKVYIWENLNICNANIFMFDVMKIFYVLLISLYLSFICSYYSITVLLFRFLFMFLLVPSPLPRLFPLAPSSRASWFVGFFSRFLVDGRIGANPTLRPQKGEKCAFANRLGISRKPRN